MRPLRSAQTPSPGEPTQSSHRSMSAGLRVGELGALNVEMLDLDEGALILPVPID